jgi:hypothetical protein
MWSHYAANHSGIVIEFDTDEQPFSHIAHLTFPVTYSAKKPDYIHYNKCSDFQKKIFAVAATKAADWSYEKEIRIIVAAGRPLRDNLYMPVSPASITAVLCGCRMIGLAKVQVRAALKPSAFAHVRILQAVLDRSEYALTFEEVNLETG